MAWPSKIFVATTQLGVYYTDDFANPAVQPTWTAVNAGLPALDCKEFDIDPFDQANRQYVLLDANHTLYRRIVGGNWVSILTPTQAETACGKAGGTYKLIESVCADLTVPGRVWVSFRWDNFTYAIRSDDYGDNWTGHYVSNLQTEWVFGIRSSGNYVFLVAHIGTSYLSRDWVCYSSNSGSSWAFYDNWDGHSFGYNPLTPGQIYVKTGVGAAHDLTRVTSGGVGTNLQGNIAIPSRQDCMWFDYTDPDHHRSLAEDKLHVTTDEWATIDSSLDIDHDPISFAPWAGDDVDQMIIGFNTATPGGTHHVIGTLYGEADTTPDHIAGTNVDTPPYTDSIPYAADNEPCERGIRALQPTVGKINTYAVAMPGYSDVGQDIGIPINGDRGAKDALRYPLRHTNDIDVGIHWTYDKLKTIIGVGGGYWFNVKDPFYGATGDGLTNDTVGVQAAFDGAHVHGGVVWFPEGTYLTDPLTSYVNVSIIGAGMNTSTIKANSAGSLLSIQYPATLTTFTGKLADFTLDGDNTGDIGLDLLGVFQMTASRITIRDFNSIGMKLRAALVLWFYDISIETCVKGVDADSATLSSTGYVQSNLVHFINSRILWNTSWGIYWKHGAMLEFTGCDTGGNGTNGNASTGNIYYQPTGDGFGLKIDGCWMEGNEGKAIILIDTPDGAGQICSITDTLFQLGSPTYGIYVEGAVRENNVICRGDAFYTDYAGGDYYANGVNATIYLDHCDGTSGGSGNIITGQDASGITYTPADAADWNGGVDPGNADDAFDQLAERTKDLEIGGGAIVDHDHSGDVGDGGQFDVANLTSNSADSGDLPTADGAGGVSWQHPGVASGQYRQFLYEVSGGTFTFLTDIIGNPLEGLQDLE